MHTLLLEGRAFGLAVDGRTCRAFVSYSSTDYSQGWVRTIDLARGTTVATIDIGPLTSDGGPAGALAVDEVRGHVFVTSSDPSSGQQVLRVLDSTTGALRQTVHVPNGLLAFDERRDRLFVLQTTQNLSASNLYTLDAVHVRVLRHEREDQWPSALAVDELSGHLFVVNDKQNAAATVDVFDSASGRRLRRVSLAIDQCCYVTGPQIAVDAPAGHVFVGLGGQKIWLNPPTVRMLDARGTLLRRINVNGTTFPGAVTDALAVDQRTGRVFVAWDWAYGGHLAVLNATSGALLHTINIGAVPTAVGIDEAHGRVYVTHVDNVNSSGSPLGPGSVSIHDATSGREICTVGVAWGPRALAIANTGQVLVLNDELDVDHQATSAITLIDSTRLCRSG